MRIMMKVKVMMRRFQSYIKERRRRSMHYSKPEMTKVVVDVKVNMNASEKGSCAGGHCVKTRYAQDP